MRESKAMKFVRVAMNRVTATFVFVMFSIQLLSIHELADGRITAIEFKEEVVAVVVVVAVLSLVLMTIKCALLYLLGRVAEKVAK